MKIKLIFLSFCLTQIVAQGKIKVHQKILWPNYDSENAGFNPERIIFGCNFGMNFINNTDVFYNSNKSSAKGFTSFVSGNFGYRFGGRTVLGINVGYNYTYVKYDYQNIINVNVKESYALKSPAYSASFYLRYFLLRNLFLHIEPEMNYRNNWNIAPTASSGGKYIFTPTKIQVPALLTGVGFVIPLGERTAFVIQGLYDVLQKENSPYSNLPIIQGGFNVGNY